jgi:hypothetical protein
MDYQKVLSCLNVVIILLGIVGCTAPVGMPTVPATTTALPISTEAQTVTPNPTPISVEASSFEECITSSGSRLDETYPRQCITKNGVVFNQTLDEGITYSKTYRTGADRPGIFITSTSDGGHLIAGISTGCWIVKLDALGEKEWESDFNQELRQEFGLPGASIWCRLARETPDGSYAAMGVAYDVNFGQYRKLFMLTLDREGNLLTAQLLSKKGEKIPYLDRDGKLIWLTSLGLTPLGIPRQVSETLDGGYIIFGHYEQSIPNSSIHIIKTDKNGAYVWDKNLCRDKKIQDVSEKSIVCSYNAVWDAIQLQDGSFAILGISNGTWLIKTDPQGNIVWIRSFPPDFGSGFALIQSAEGGVLIAGEKDVDQKQRDGMLLKTDSTGIFEWIKTYGGSQNDGFTAIAQRSNGEITVMGWTKSFEARTRLWFLGTDSAIIK